MTSAVAAPRVLRLVHASPGRLRIRLHRLREDRYAAVATADHPARSDGVIEVAVRRAPAESRDREWPLSFIKI